MKSLHKPIVILLALIFLATISACPKQPPQNIPQELYNVGTWGGQVLTTARLVLREENDYWNRAWRMEANVTLNEFDDGSLSGVAHVQLFCWDTHNGLILKYEDIAQGQWDQYGTVDLILHGKITDEGYEITADELPVSLLDPNNSTRIIDFWDFLYPSLLEGVWAPDGTRAMTGDSVRVQGDDYEDTRRMETFREFSVQYTWNIEKL
ncbi:MAG: hypothetical protein NTY09_12260 [bacterium]|nr:hypothetical protein [bacterium]